MPSCPPLADMDEMPHGGMWDLASWARAEGWIVQLEICVSHIPMVWSSTSGKREKGGSQGNKSPHYFSSHGLLWAVIFPCDFSGFGRNPTSLGNISYCIASQLFSPYFFPSPYMLGLVFPKWSVSTLILTSSSILIGLLPVSVTDWFNYCKKSLIIGKRGSLPNFIQNDLAILSPFIKPDIEILELVKSYENLA